VEEGIFEISDNFRGYPVMPGFVPGIHVFFCLSRDAAARNRRARLNSWHFPVGFAAPQRLLSGGFGPK
jgi:hypothetical protein